MSAPAAPVAPAAPAAPSADAPKSGSLLDAARSLKATRAAPVQGPKDGFVKLNGKPIPPPTRPNPAQAAGAPAPDAARNERGQFVAKEPAAPPAAPAVQGEGAKANVEAKRAVTEQVMGEEKPASTRHKVKVDGQEREVPIEELVQNYQIRSHLDKELRSIAEYRNLAKKDFKGLVEKLAQEYQQDPTAVAEQLLMKKAESWQEQQMLEQMSPEQREYYQLKKADEARKADEKRASDEKAAADAKAAKEAAGRETYERTTNILIEAHKLMPEGIRNHPDYGARAFDRVKSRLRALASQVPGNTPIESFLATVDPKALAVGALEDHRADLRLALETAADDDIERLIPDSVREKIIARARAAMAAKHPQLTARPQVGNGKKDEKKAEPKPLSAFKPSFSQMINRTRRG